MVVRLVFDEARGVNLASGYLFLKMLMSQSLAMCFRCGADEGWYVGLECVRLN